MKKTGLYIVTIFFLLVTLVLGVYFDKMLQNTKLKNTELHILPLQKTFIQASDLQKYLNIKDSIYKDLNVKNLEKKLEQNDYIEQAEVYVNLNGKLVAKVEQYHPIARVMGNQSYYLDENGDKKPLSGYYTEKVVLVFGRINEKNKKNTLKLLHKINNNKDLNNIISEIHIFGNDYVLKIKDLPANILISGLKSFDGQFIKLQTIYTYLLTEKKQNLYKQIDLRYKNQVVCKK